MYFEERLRTAASGTHQIISEISSSYIYTHFAWIVVTGTF